MKECPSCGRGEWITCCEAYQKYIKRNDLDPREHSHSCGEQEVICMECGYRDSITWLYGAHPTIRVREEQRK